MLVTGVTQALHADLKHEPETRPRAAGQERDGFQPPSSGVSYQRGRRPHPNPQSDKRDDCLKPNPHLVWLVLPRWRTLWTVKRLAGKPPGRPLHSGRFVSDGRPPAWAAGFPGCGHGTRALALAPPAPAWAHGARLSFEIYMQDSQESIENARQVCRARSAANLLTVRDTGTRRGLGAARGRDHTSLKAKRGASGEAWAPPQTPALRGPSRPPFRWGASGEESAAALGAETGGRVLVPTEWTSHSQTRSEDTHHHRRLHQREAAGYLLGHSLGGQKPERKCE